VIAIIDYGMGNLRSVSKALEHLGFEAQISRDPELIATASHVILPGVGAFGAAMNNLYKLNLIRVVKDAAASGKPFLGICLGMQLLLEHSCELGIHEGLGIIPGRVIKFFDEAYKNIDASQLKIPHMGWNSINIRRTTPFLSDVPDGSMVYFVHSYYVVPSDPSVVAATTEHGVEYCSVIARDNVFATQFHPEKSGAIGLKMLQNFAEAS